MSLRIILAGLPLALLALGAPAQQAAAPAEPASAAQGCAKVRHDHAVDKHMTSAQSRCGSTARKSNTAKAGTKWNDHGRVHKGQ